ncbi:hypothetical protein F0L68_09480 [Solihabitans fulvus]|uniref:Uncharacterized protein n=1 Tax=Solihabitans fulvus TaxID=1892852 RepID=A0A5B2XLE5_9PSEU|nr:DUF6474 family protein [Solihabitans fulvus]KAA2263711.1 hypothetical protein F0L68_09480 [Solihabitans fulvus]
MARAKRTGPRLTPGKAKNLLGVAKVIGPVVIPVVLPIAVRAAGIARETFDRYRARQLGVEVDQLPAFTGRGARLHARIAGLSAAVEDLRARNGSSEVTAFADASATRLSQLTAAVRAAERMPSPRRRAANRAVAADLDRLEAEVLHRLGVD